MFAATSVRNQDMNDDEVAILHRLRQRLTWAADLTIMIHSPSALCLQRQRAREREGETVTFAYLDQLEVAHAEAFRTAHWVDGTLTADQIERATLRPEAVVKLLLMTWRFAATSAKR